MTNFFTHKFRKRSPIQIVGIIIFGVIAITGLAILFGFIVMWLWNWLMPEVFGLTTLTYWQAVGMFILLKILLGGIGGGSGSSNKKSSKHKHDGCRKESKTDFSRWKHYDKFWKEEGNAHFEQYVAQKEGIIDNTSESE